jgi:hypothetical protein
MPFIYVLNIKSLNSIFIIPHQKNGSYLTDNYQSKRTVPDLFKSLQQA